MPTRKIFGILESPDLLLEPVSEVHYRLEGPVDPDLVGSWMTVQGEVMGETIAQARVVKVEKNQGKVTRSGVIVADAPNPPPEASEESAFLYQVAKGRYYLLSAGPPGEPVQGDFSAYVGQSVQVTGVLSSVPYILYNARVRVKS